MSKQEIELKEQSKREETDYESDGESDPESDSDSDDEDEAEEEKYSSVPFYPRNNKIPDKIWATFHPSKHRILKPPEEEGKKVDDPRKVFDNNPSDLPWDDTGRFESSSTMKDLINTTALKDSGFGVFLGYGLTLVSCGIWLIYKRKAIPEGRFRIVKKSLHHEIRLAGHHTLPSVTARWQEEKDLDDESTNIVRVGNRSIVNVPVNHLGVAFLVGNKVIEHSEKISQIVRDKDVVLFSQGSYVLDESRYRGITVSNIPADESIVRIGSVTIMQIGTEEIGGAKNRATQRFHVFQTGAPLLFDDKEWSDYQVRKRQTNTFSIGPYTYLTLSGREIASVTRKNGKSLLLLKKGTYKLHAKEWQKYEKKENGDVVNLDHYYIRTVEEDDVAVVKNLKSGEYFEMKPGKYHLMRKVWNEPEIVKLDQAIVRCGPYSYVRIQDDYFTGSRNVRTGNFVEFTQVGEILKLHTKEHPVIERVRKVSYEEQPFGPFTIITIPDGSFGVFEESGEIRIAKPSTYKLNPGCTVLETLPNRPQQIRVDNIEFISKDQYYMKGNAIFHFEMSSPETIAKELRSRQQKTGRHRGNQTFSFKDLVAELTDRCTKSLLRMLRQHTLADLSPMGGQEEENEDEKEEKEKEKEDEKTDEDLLVEMTIQNICDSILKELSDYVERANLGITFTKTEISGGFQLADRTVIENFGRLAKLRLEKKVNIIDGKVKQDKERVESMIVKEKILREKDIALTKAEQEREIELKQKEGELIIKKKEIENDKLLQKTKLDMSLLEKKNEAESRQIKLEMDIQEKQQKADAESYAIKKKADAEAYSAELKNKSTQNRPKILDELQKMEKLAEFAKYYGQAAWNNRDIMEMLQKKMTLGMGDFMMMKEFFPNEMGGRKKN